MADRKPSKGLERVGESDFFRAIAKELEAKAPTPPKPVTRSERLLLEAAVDVQQDPPDSDELAFMARELVQCTLPHSDPGQVPFWARRNGNFTLSLTSQFDPRTSQLVGYPFGSIPRLLLFWMTSEALRTGERRLELGSTYNEFLRAVGLSANTGGGKRGDAKRLQNQTRRLFTTNISFIYSEVQANGPSPEARLNMNVASKMLLWWDPKKPDQMNLWDNWIELSDEFFKAITAAPVPLDTRALKALKRSPLALDLYAWSTHKALAVSRKGRQQFVPWRGLAAQFGADYKDPKDFRRKAEDALKRIQTVYPGLKLAPATGGLIVLPSSRPAIASKPRKRLPPAKR
jgi:hypothetical protein